VDIAIAVVKNRNGLSQRLPLVDGTPETRVSISIALRIARANALNCAVVNLSELPESRMVFPRVSRHDLLGVDVCQALLAQQNSAFHSFKVAEALATEKALAYMATSGKYWEHLEKYDAAKLSHIDDLWLASMKPN